jgi:protein TonB
MPSRRTFLICTGLSALFHLLLFWLAAVLPAPTARKEEVMMVKMADIPRSADFLPPQAGIIGKVPPAAPPPAPPKERPPAEMTGRVPDLPVKPDLPPERSFPAPRPKAEAKEEPKEPREREERQAKAEGTPPGRAQEPERGEGKSAPPSSGSPRSLRDLTPSLGKLVMARDEPSGGRGKGETRGNAVGTGGKAAGKEGVTEEGGGGFRLTPLNAPEIQYISYFASIKRKIELVWQYPYDAAVQGIQGDLQIDFVIGRSGKVEGIELVRGSGHKILDDEAIQSIRKAAPFDPIPAEYKIPNLVIRGRFIYVHGGALRLR